MSEHLSGLSKRLSAIAFTLFVVSACDKGRGGANNDDSDGPQTDNAASSTAAECSRTVVADIVALNQRIVFNRLGTALSFGMMYALARDIEVATTPKPTESNWQWLPDTTEWQAYESCQQNPPDTDPDCSKQLSTVAAAFQASEPTDLNPKNQVRLRTDKRPRPLILRANQGDCLEVNLANLLSTNVIPGQGLPNTNTMGFHPVGLELVNKITNDNQNVGKNPESMTAPGEGSQYKFKTNEVSVHFVSSSADDNNAQLNAGLFGAVHVQPRGAEYYRSQVTRKDLEAASTWNGTGNDKYLTIDYQKQYPSGSGSNWPKWKQGVPILRMTQAQASTRPGTRLALLYSDLSAMITGPNAGRFPGPAPAPEPDWQSPDYPARPDPLEPFREFAILYHEPGAAAQAFEALQPNSPIFKTLEAGADKFGINYGTGGISAEIYANRIGVGPMANCEDCRYEEFFLSAWTVGDPAMNVDCPAGRSECRKANASTLAYYPDDPSNVYHSYLRDHVKMQLHHAGGVHHVHHLHAHQWLHSPENKDGHYLDSQLFGPASSFTLDIAYGGGGNRNLTVGDSIFHCHFYPHFAQGMWGMWRVHDVLEAGTELEPSDKDDPSSPKWPTKDARALPDGEIERGTPIPAIVPLPTLAMAPSPSLVYIDNGQTYFGKRSEGKKDRWGSTVTTNPGYPFFIPGIAGSRAPHPPMDFAVMKTPNGNKLTLNGGLPRHVVKGGESGAEFHSKYDFSKFSKTLDALELPEGGTPVEKIAMTAHAASSLSTHTPEPGGETKNFHYNGLPPVAGAPYADPCPLNSPMRKYRGADVQHDVVLNKDGWHYPQQRFMLLWDDIQKTFDNKRPPQPFFMRANSTECIEYWLTNLVPSYYELDNFQVRTPTDILGQHIHLVKFDVTASDGAANGFNYEDGTFSYEEVRDRIDEINAAGGLQPFKATDPRVLLKAKLPKYLKSSGLKNLKKYRGAQTTVQRWWADPLLTKSGADRTIRTVFTHDHFGPSTHQQAGLYAGLLVEPENSTWVMAELDKKGKEVKMGTREDGGPTSWQAVIKTPFSGDSYREFALEFQDLALAYTSGGAYKATPYPAKNEKLDSTQATAQDNAQNSLPATDGKSIRQGGTFNGTKFNGVGGYIHCSDSPCKLASAPPIAAPPGPQAISSLGSNFDSTAWGTYSTNYRSEPLAMHLAASIKKNTDQPAPADCSGDATNEACDTGFVFKSMQRKNTALNSQHLRDKHFPKRPLSSGVYPTDPFTPLLRAHEGEKIQIRTLVGAHVQMHNFALHGLSWLFEPSASNSGYRDSQSMGISEHFEMNFRMPPATMSATPIGKATNLCRGKLAESFSDYLYTASSSLAGLTQGNWGLIRSYRQGTGACLTPVPSTPTVAANTWACPPPCKEGESASPECAPVRKFKVSASNQKLVYNKSPDELSVEGLVYSGCDATMTPNCEPAAPSQDMSPMVLRARAGECIEVTLSNNYDAGSTTFSTATPLTANGNSTLANAIDFDGVTASPSKQAGLHPQMLAFDPATSAGINAGFNPTQTVGPGQSTTYTWYAGLYDPIVDPITTSQPAPAFKPMEFGVVNLYAPDPLRQANIGQIGAMVIEPIDASWTARDSTLANAVITTKSGEFYDVVLITTETSLNSFTTFPQGILANYGTEPLNSANDRSDAVTQYSNTPAGSPDTPVFEVPAGKEVRFRVVHPWGFDQEVFEIYGHLWQEEPYLPGSATMGNNPEANYQGFREGWGATNRLNVLIPSAGGQAKVPGDYLYRLRDIQVISTQGVWGILRVTDS